jgi:FtsX-like permease family
METFWRHHGHRERARERFHRERSRGSVTGGDVNEALAARAWPGVDPLGKRLRLAGDDVLREVVGVARTVNYETLAEAPQPCLYLPIRQQFSDAAVLYVRTQGDPTGILGTVQRTIRAMDGHIDVGDVRTIETVISQSLFGATAGVGLLSLFGVMSLGLASLGLYGAVAYGVKQRRREIGMRIVLGARKAAVLGLVLRQALAPVGVAIVLGSDRHQGGAQQFSRLLAVSAYSKRDCCRNRVVCRLGVMSSQVMAAPRRGDPDGRCRLSPSVPDAGLNDEVIVVLSETRERSIRN